jgi:hypothetical protein
MRIPSRDVLATVLVGLGVVIYLAWLVGYPAPVLDDPATIAIAVLVLGIGASMSAVVPGFSELLHGSRPYLGVTSVLGLVAFLAGLWAIYATDEVALAVMVVCTVILWLVSTVRHTTAAEAGSLA